jgi:septal ring factor EnvC (AmiA/AmiB activator)
MSLTKYSRNDTHLRKSAVRKGEQQMPPEKINPYYDGLIESIKTTTNLIQELTKDLKSSEISQASLKERINQIQKDVETLTHIVRDGNGEKSIMTRMALAEDDLRDMRDRDSEFRKFVYGKVEEINTMMMKIESEAEKKKSEEENRIEFNRSKILTILKIMPGIIALITILIQYFIK